MYTASDSSFESNLRQLLSVEQLLAPFRSGDKDGQMEILTRHCSSFPGNQDSFAAGLVEILKSHAELNVERDEYLLTTLRVLAPHGPSSVGPMLELLQRPEVRATTDLSRDIVEALEIYSRCEATVFMPHPQLIGTLLNHSYEYYKANNVLFKIACCIGPHMASQTERVIEMLRTEAITYDQFSAFVRGLAGCGDEQLVDALANLTDEDCGTQLEIDLSCACQELSAIGVSKLGWMLRSEDGGPLARVLCALGPYGARTENELEYYQARSFVPRITELLEHDELRVVMLAVDTLEKLALPKDSVAISGLADLLKLEVDNKDDELMLRKAVSRALFIIHARELHGFNPEPSPDL